MFHETSEAWNSTVVVWLKKATVEIQKMYFLKSFYFSDRNWLHHLWLLFHGTSETFTSNVLKSWFGPWCYKNFCCRRKLKASLIGFFVSIWQHISNENSFVLFCAIGTIIAFFISLIVRVLSLFEFNERCLTQNQWYLLNYINSIFGNSARIRSERKPRHFIYVFLVADSGSQSCNTTRKIELYPLLWNWAFSRLSLGFGSRREKNFCYQIYRGESKQPR